MPLPRINIRYLNGQLGTVPESRDGLLAIVVIGATAVSSTFTLGTAYRLRRPDDLADLGVTAENNARLVELVGQFYGESPEGTPVYVVGYASTESMTSLCTPATGALKGLLKTLRGELRGLVIASAKDDEPEVTEGLDPDVFTALPEAQELAVYAAMELYSPVFIALEGRAFESAADLKDLSQEDFNFCCVVIGDTSAGGAHAAMGTFAGRAAACAVQRNIGCVADGPLAPEQMYVGDMSVDEAGDELDDIHDKGYIVPRPYMGRTGVWWADDRMACDPGDDYAHLTARRTVDKAVRIAYDTMVGYLLSEIEVDADGTMQDAVVKSLQAAVESAIDERMTALGELSTLGTSGKSDGSGCSCYIDPDQNVVSGKTLEMTLKVHPFGYYRDVTVNLGFLMEN